jgi:DNA repair protein RecO (recombination protein O)
MKHAAESALKMVVKKRLSPLQAMKYKTRGIVLGYLKYGESSIIVRILTEQFGLQSYIVNGVRSVKSKGKLAIYQPLTLLDMVVYHKGDGKLSRIAEVSCAYPYKHIPFDFKKSGMALFMAEMLEKCIKEEEANQSMFNFLFDSFRTFDDLPINFENFHLQLLLKLTFHLGILPESSDEFFREGGSPFSISTEQENAFINYLLHAQYHEHRGASIQLRRSVLKHLIDFFRIHIGGLNQINSLDVLQEIMS